MTLSDLKLYRYCLPLRKKLILKGASVEHREGFLVELWDSTGGVSYGEIAPLEGFSRETLKQAEGEIKRIRASLLNSEIPSEVEKLDGGFEKWLSTLNLSPSVRFGLESAVLNLLSLSGGVTMPQLLNGKAASDVKVNALLSGTKEDVLKQADSAIEVGYSCLKLKIGGIALDDAIDLVRTVRQHVGNNATLRLDANRSFVIGDALTLIDAIADCAIEYIEEPTQNLNQLRKLLSEKGQKIGIALDESLIDIKPEDLSLPFNLKAVVLKPMFLGMEKAIRFARAAIENGIMPVISSGFESSVGIRVLASIASVYAPEIPAGLDTINWLGEDVAEPQMLIKNGQINAENYTGDMVIRQEALEEVIFD